LLLLLPTRRPKRWKGRAALGRLRNAVPDRSLGLSRWRRAMCARGDHSATIGNTRIISAGRRGQSDEIRRQVAAALVLKRIPSIEQIRLFLFVFEEVNDKVDDRRCCVKIAIESIPDNRDEITRPGLGRRVVAQGELNACDGIGGVLCESAQPREYRCVTSWEKKLVW
jgi:hypothetical protein